MKHCAPLEGPQAALCADDDGRDRGERHGARPRVRSGSGFRRRAASSGHRSSCAFGRGDDRSPARRACGDSASRRSRRPVRARASRSRPDSHSPEACVSGEAARRTRTMPRNLRSRPVSVRASRPSSRRRRAMPGLGGKRRDGGAASVSGSTRSRRSASLIARSTRHSTTQDAKIDERRDRIGQRVSRPFLDDAPEPGQPADARGCPSAGGPPVRERQHRSRPRPGLREPPQHRRAAMAQQRMRAAAQHRGHPTTLLGRPRVVRPHRHPPEADVIGPSDAMRDRPWASTPSPAAACRVTTPCCTANQLPNVPPAT